MSGMSDLHAEVLGLVEKDFASNVSVSNADELAAWLEIDMGSDLALQAYQVYQERMAALRENECDCADHDPFVSWDAQH